MIKGNLEEVLSKLKNQVAGIMFLCLLIGLFVDLKAQSSEEFLVFNGEATIADLNNDVSSLASRGSEYFWKAESKTPTPLVLYIHGGGWGGGSKEQNNGTNLNLLKNGVSYVSINYRLARGENKMPCSLHDAARALQFVPSKATEWNNPDRIIATGGSAGGLLTDRRCLIRKNKKHNL